MSTRSSRSKVKFSQSFVLSGYSDEFPAGDYEVVVEEELLQGLGFEAYRRTATFLTVHGTGGRVGRTEMRPIIESDLESALSRDRVFVNDANASEAALSPLGDLK